ncbi:hypothetical protein GCM10017779_19460 [Streptomyces capillispiralis]|nr:hypothetical protein GCM10017779_19460 [Streptomyces capillispiralis]
MLVPVWFVLMTGAAVAVPGRSITASAASTMVQVLLMLRGERPRLRPPGRANTLMGRASCDGRWGGSTPDSVGPHTSTVNSFGESFEIFEPPCAMTLRHLHTSPCMAKWIDPKRSITGRS